MSKKFDGLTLMLLIWRVVQPHGDEDEEDQERPHDLHQELKLRDRRRREAVSAMATITHMLVPLSAFIKMSSENPHVLIRPVSSQHLSTP